MKLSRGVAALLASAMVLGAAASASAQQVVRVRGNLSCSVSSAGVSLLQATRNISCFYYRNGSRNPEGYVGQISKSGLIFNVPDNSVAQIDWHVDTHGAKVAKGGLAGTYTGKDAEVFLVSHVAGAVLGGPDHVLVHSSGAVVLNPVAESNQAGINVASGATTLTLTPAPVAGSVVARY